MSCIDMAQAEESTAKAWFSGFFESAKGSTVRPLLFCGGLIILGFFFDQV